jgi:hypothetical protein
MDEQFFNLVQVVPNYYGAGHDATFYFLSFPALGRYAEGVCDVFARIRGAVLCGKRREDSRRVDREG